jgi:hypothetical protein
MMSDKHINRFWAKVAFANDGACWTWKGTKINGRAYFHLSHTKRAIAARIMYALTRGPIPEGLFICHKCDNALCVNPSHLYAGTHQQNMADRDARGRNWQAKVTHCPRGHAYDQFNTRPKGPNGSHRACRACQRIHHANHLAKRSSYAAKA